MHLGIDFLVQRCRDVCACVQADLRYIGRDALAVLLEIALGFSNYAHGVQADLRYIGRDALAVLLGAADDGAPRCDAACVLDVRRGDERALYGSITGAPCGSAGDACLLPGCGRHCPSVGP